MPAWLIAQSRQSELMDDPALPAAEHMHALDALARINALSLTSLHIARAVTRMLATDSMALQAHRDPGQPLHVVDVACGGGDVTVSLARSLRRRLAQGTTGTRTMLASSLKLLRCGVFFFFRRGARGVVVWGGRGADLLGARAHTHARRQKHARVH